MPDYGSHSTNKIQMGRETTKGTAVAADIIWRGEPAAIEDTSVIQRVVESIGLNLNSGRTFVAQKSASLRPPPTPATFEHLPHLLAAGVEDASPSGAGPYTYDYAPSLTATPNAVATYTIESGNAIAGDGAEMEYSFVSALNLTGEIGGSWMMQPTWMGRQRTEAAMTGGLSVVAVEEILFGKTSLYIDATGGTIGSTQKTGVLQKAAINLEQTGLVPLFSADGALYFTSHKWTPPRLTFSITIELESGGVVAAERAFLQSQAFRLFRLRSSGTSNRQMTIDFAGKYTSIGDYENSNGNTVVTFNGEADYSSSDSLFFNFVIINNLSALP
jgi:hypothetical protein